MGLAPYKNRSKRFKNKNPENVVPPPLNHSKAFNYKTNLNNLIKIPTNSNIINHLEYISNFFNTGYNRTLITGSSKIIYYR